MNVPLQTLYGQGSLGAAGTCTATNCSANPTAFGPRLADSVPVYDHWAELFQAGYSVDNNLTISGGGDRTNFYFSGEYLSHDGTIVGPHNWYDRAAVRLKASHRLLDNLTLSGNFAYADVSADFVEKGSNTSGLLLGALRTPPDFNEDRKSTRLNSSHLVISYAVFCLKKKNNWYCAHYYNSTAA